MAGKRELEGIRRSSTLGGLVTMSNNVPFAVLVVVVGVGVGLITITGTGLAESSATQSIPPLSEGTEATYELNGPTRTILRPIGPGLAASGVDTARLEVRSGQVPSETGELVDSRMLRFEAANGTVLHASVARNGQGFAFLESTNASWPGFRPLTWMKFSPTVGAMDALLFENATLPDGEYPLTRVVPEAPALDESAAVGVSLDDARLNVSWVDTSKGREAHVRVENVRNQDTSYAVEYVLTPDCPLPKRIDYSQVSDGLDPFTVARLSCHLGEGADRVEVPPLDRPETEPFERRLPGGGGDLPLPYEPAIEAFLNFPDTWLYRQLHPSWRTACVTLENQTSGGPLNFPPPEGWTWYFRLSDGDGATANWTAPIEPTERVDPVFTRDPTPPDKAASLCPEGPIQRGTPVAPLGVFATAAQNVWDQGEWKDEAILKSFNWKRGIVGDQGFVTVDLSRCSHPSNNHLGFCTEYVPHVVFRLDGMLDQVSLRPLWFAGDVPRLLNAS